MNILVTLNSGYVYPLTVMLHSMMQTNPATRFTIYVAHSSLTPSDFAKIRASVVCEAGLDKVADEIGIGECLYLSRGEALNGGRERKSMIADAVEALFAAVFLDGGMDEAKRVILSLTEKYINEYSGKNPKITEYKTS